MFALAHNEEGSATVVEYAIVLPIVVLALLLLICLGNMMYDKAQIEAAAERAALYVGKTVSDPNYADITTRDDMLNEIDEIAIGRDDLKAYPYRYLFGRAGKNVGDLEGDVENIVRKNQLIRNEGVDARIKVSSGVSHKVTVTITETYELPGMFSLMGVPPIAKVSARSVVWVNEPAEFVRNADLAIDLVEEVSDKTGLTEKLNRVKSAVSFFKDNTQSKSED